MKLVSLCIITISFISKTGTQKLEDEPFPFLPHFQQQGPNDFVSDSSLYLPLESHTAVPYFAMKNTNKLPFQYLPATGTKAPASFPTPFPMVISSSIVPNFDDDDDEPTNKREIQRIVSTRQPPYQQNRFNSTEKPVNVQKEPEKREMRPIPRTVNYEHPIDRIDVKPGRFPPNSGVTAQPSRIPSSTPKRPISHDSLGHRSDQGPELIKAGSFSSNNYFPLPGAYYNHLQLSSTTEPAIPILRLSNEMDLDGSFSYEALGADQTHYVQHSRMENMGTDKEEQVVEGSYSYVGDNGQTYTVHYIADSNGFRASGDHLPVPPPMPEIIQRAVQYNLAEEAKRPPHLKSWQDDENNREAEAEKIQRFPQANTNSIRNLFTGRTPEAFSYNFSPEAAQNKLATAASSQVNTNIDYTKDQTQVKNNNGPIAPQITFLASQGAHVPSMNTVPQSIARVFTTEKPNMPQLMNYEAVINNAEQENNKALWRWQYGINANIPNNNNNNKNTISRSSGDEIMINFNDMTPEQYSSAIHSEIDSNNGQNTQQSHNSEQQPNPYQNEKSSENVQNPTKDEYQKQISSNDNNNINMNQDYYKLNSFDYQTQNNYINQNIKMENDNLDNKYSMNEVSPAPPAELSTNQYHENWYKTVDQSTEYHTEQPRQIENHKPASADHRSKIITHHDFLPASQTVTKSYDYEDNFYEIRKTNDGNSNVKFIYSSPSPVYFSSSMNNYVESDLTVSTTKLPPISSSESNIKFTDFIKYDDDSKFTPLLNKNIEEHLTEETTTTEQSMKEILESNIFLKHLIRKTPKENNTNMDIKDSKPQFQTKINAEPKAEKITKFIPYQTNMSNDLKGYRKKASDLSNILNFVIQKNHFESNKVKPKKTPMQHSNTIQTNKYIPTNTELLEEQQEKVASNINNYRPLNQQQQEELRGIIKNYKVLQRNNNIIRNEEDRLNQLRRDLSPPPVRMLHSPNLPPLGRAGPSMKSYLPPIFV